MTVEANSKPPIHQRNDGIDFRAIAIGWIVAVGYEPANTCDSSVNARRKAGLSSEAESASK